MQLRIRLLSTEDACLGPADKQLNHGREHSIARAAPLPDDVRAVRGRCEVNRKVAGACPAGREFPVYFLVVETQKKGRGMHFSNSIFVQLLKPINRRQFQAIVERHDGNAYDKSFKSWEHLVTLIFAQLSCAGSLRGLTETWNANPQHHYHLGTQVRLKRSTLSDGNERRPVAVFAGTRREGKEMVRI